MNCPTCEYDLDPLAHEACPRCGTVVSCASFDCAECNACAGSLTGFALDLLPGAGDDEE